jgi:hypothetical protein
MKQTAGAEQQERVRVQSTSGNVRKNVELVEALITAAEKHDRAVLKLNKTVKAIQEWRVWQLVYADGFAPHGSQCVNCGALYAERKESCDYCGKAVEPVSDFVERAAARVFDMEGKVEQVRGPAAERLQEVGSVGAFLIY